MKRELVNYIGSLLFDGGSDTRLQLTSEKQFMVARDGSFQREQSVITDILVAKEAIYLTYRLTDGQILRVENAVTDVDCEVKNDYTTGSVVYTTVDATKKAAAGNKETTLFILDWDDEHLLFYEEKDGKICFEIRNDK
jgi:hypothetical protein